MFMPIALEEQVQFCPRSGLSRTSQYGVGSIAGQNCARCQEASRVSGFARNLVADAIGMMIYT